MTLPATSPSNLDELTRVHKSIPEWRVELALDGTPRNKLCRYDFSAIEEKPHATTLKIYAFTQSAFEQVMARFGLQFTAIYFWKSPRIADLTPLESLPNLELVAFYWNQKANKLWDFSRTPHLRGLAIEDFTQLHHLDDLRAATSLNELVIGDRIWRKSVFQSLEPLESLLQLKSLSFVAKRLEDGKIEPLAQLQNLTSLELAANQFTTRQIAWLRARMPDSLSARAIEPVWTFENSIGEGEQEKDVLVVGKRKPFLNSTRDAARIARYVSEFWRMVEEFRQRPELLPGEA